jgi:MoaA/NifB/PqqE/SkfB family radical SAM enzyme
LSATVEISPRAYRNAVLNLRECRDRKDRLSSYPLKLYIEPTDACHLRCEYCYPPEQRDRAVMGMETFRAIEEQLFGTCCEVNLYLSGEPVLSRHLPEMMEVCSRYELVTKTFTSLSYKNDEILKLFVERGVWVNVSFDGPEATRRFRRGSDLALIEDNIAKLVEYGRVVGNPRFHLRLASVIGHHNAPRLVELVQWAQRSGFREVQLGCMDVSSPLEHLGLRPEDAAHFERAVEQADELGVRISTPSHVGGRRIHRPSNWDDVPLEIDRFFPHFVETSNPDVERRFCPYGWIQTVVTARGEVLSCCQRKIPMGRFDPGTDFISEVWNNEMYRSLRRLADHRGCLMWAPSRTPCNMLTYSIWGGETALGRIDHYESDLQRVVAED